MTTPHPAFLDPEEQSWIRAAVKLSGDDLAARRAQLADRPEDVRLRVEVLSALCRRTRTGVDPDLPAEHLGWMLSHRPGSDASRVACAMLSMAADPALRDRFAPILQRAADAATTPRELEYLSYYHSQIEPVRAKELLLRGQVEAHPDDAAIAANAAQFFWHDDKRRALALLERARDLEPENPERHKEIASFLDLERPRAGPEERHVLAARVHAELERAHALDTRSEHIRDFGLPRLARAALTADDLARAGELARRLIDPERSMPHLAGAGIYEGRLILGELALRLGDVAAAKEHLLAATDIPGRPLFSPSGPRTELARALLEAGERETVALYLERCARLFEKDLAPWLSAIRQGRTPDFPAER